MFKPLIPLFALALLAISPAHAADTPHEHGHETAAPTRDASHEHADHHAGGATLQLDDGKKWATDAPLRAAMAGIRNAVAEAHGPIHAGQFSDDQYAALAGTVEAGVAEMVAKCQLAPAADAQLHLVLGDLLAGAKQMKEPAEGSSRMLGTARVMGALDNYANFFDDAGFQPVPHMPH